MTEPVIGTGMAAKVWAKEQSFWTSNVVLRLPDDRYVKCLDCEEWLRLYMGTFKEER
jgi:hypothetical protein